MKRWEWIAQLRRYYMSLGWNFIFNKFKNDKIKFFYLTIDMICDYNPLKI